MRLSKVKTPILILSGMAGIEDKVRGLGFGADDYMTKPFHKDELVARIHAIVRRSKGHAQSVISTGELIVNLDAKTVEVGGQRVHLTGKEYQMLELLSLRKGTTLTKERFLNHLYGGMDEPELKIIDVFICKLRKKLANAAGGEQTISKPSGAVAMCCASRKANSQKAPDITGHFRRRCFAIPHNAGTPRLIVPEFSQKPADDGGLFRLRDFPSHSTMSLRQPHEKAAAWEGNGSSETKLDDGIDDQAATDRLPNTLVRILRSKGLSRKSSAPARLPAIIFFRSGLDHAIIDAHGLALGQSADIGDQFQRAIETRIDDDDVGQFRFAAHQRFQTIGGFGNEEGSGRRGCASRPCVRRPNHRPIIKRCISSSPLRYGGILTPINNRMAALAKNQLPRERKGQFIFQASGCSHLC